MTRPLYDDDDGPRFHPEHIDDNINANPGGKKFMQKEVPPMTRLTDEQVKALIVGCEGVTPGPWEGSGTLVGIYIEGRREWTLVAKTEKGREFPLEYRRNTSHIARCDPDTIRALATEVKESREAMHGLSVTTDTITDVANQVLESRKRNAELEAERDAWKANAIACGKMLQSFTPGGSEYFGREINGAFPTDSEACGAVIRGKMESLHEARKSVVLIGRERDAALAHIAELEAALAKAKETANVEFTAKLRYRDERMAAEAEVKRLRKVISALAEQAAHCIMGFQIGTVDIKKAMIELEKHVIRSALWGEDDVST
jgi:hypothetical protein